LNPADKRLAVRTEDHPLSYGSFEGTIPKGQYGGGTVMLWDQGTWEPTGDPKAGLKKGHLAFTLHGERLKGGWDLIRMRGDGKRENWLLIKRKDNEARNGAKDELLEDQSFSVSSGRSMEDIAGGVLKRLIKQYPEVELATLVKTPPSGSQWLHEIKFDGYRLLGYVAGGESRLRTRNGKDWTDRFPAVAAALEKLRVKEAVLDMEAVVLDAEGKSSFQALQAALGGEGNTAKIVAYAFDLLHLDGKNLTGRPLTERKENLQSLLKNSKDHPALLYSKHIEGQGEKMFAQACAKGLEGIVSKIAESRYETGRQNSWLKCKCGQRQEFIILGFSKARKGERALGALYLGYRKAGELRYAGKVGTGFTMKSARDLVERFEQLALKKPAMARADTAGMSAREWESIQWIKPVLICEVAFTEWTQDGRIRHPSFQGLREDKDAGEVKKETPAPAAAVSATGTKKNAEGFAIGGIAITHPDRVISKIGAITKGRLAEYYSAVMPLLLPRIIRRPLSVLRCPSGIEGECFYQRNPGKGLGPEVHTFKFRHKSKNYEYLYIEDEKGLLELIQMGAIEIHPWGATIDAIEYPDRLIFDLDPAPDVRFKALKLAAEDLRQRLQQAGLEPLLKCTGGKGLHVIVPLAGKDKWPAVKSFAASIAQGMEAAVPEAYVATMSKAKRTGKIFVDYFRNDITATAVADYSARARPGMPVALPLDWKELKTLKAASQFTMDEAEARVKNKETDPFSKSKAQAIPRT
jgi:bifunctional non-homologous end joining protein LigD